MKDIFNSEFTVPSFTSSGDFALFPTDSNYYQSDFEAVMASKEDLRIWSHSSWPEEDFTLEVNREDLKIHESDNRDHSAYGFMLYNKDRTFCFGSAYLYPLARSLRFYEFSQGEREKFDQYSARLDFWIRSGDKKAHFEWTKMLRDWFLKEWPVKTVMTHRRQMPEREKIYRELGLKREFELQSLSDQSPLFLYPLT